MLRIVNVILMASALAAALALTVFKQDTRQLEASIEGKERRLDQLNADIAVLRAERAHAARPDRLEKLARDLGLRPIQPDQYIRVGNPSPAGD
ncbi:MAG: cell division protein FtsL [Hyphomicrobiaceae bacterium]|jgi:cell division protein FtsL